MADFIQRPTLSSVGLSGAVVQWTTAGAGQQSLATPIVVAESEVTPGDPSTSDLLQQAMNAVSFDASGGVSYMEQNGEVVYVQEDGKLVSLRGVVAPADVAVMSVTQPTGVVCVDQNGAFTQDVGGVLYKGDNRDVSAFLPTDLDIINVTSSTTLMYSSPVESAYSAADVTTPQTAYSNQVINVSSISDNLSTSKAQNNASNLSSESAPLGSSGNPIRIIQRGNQYTAMQHLTPDQLTQILQVIQEQQQRAQAKNPSSSDSAILYNPDAGSQVVYRITTSSNSNAEGDSSSGTLVQMVFGADLGHQKRLFRKRKKEDDERMVGSELSRQEKEERKKHRPRTRSGRVSKPPQYMVKDYKHIHPVDYDEDYDDSDGGYSDFRHSGDEEDYEDRQLKDDVPQSGRLCCEICLHLG